MSMADPLTLPSGLLLANRLAKAAMSETLGDAEGAPSERLCTLTRRFAAGGLGLQITGNVMVDPMQIAEPGNVVADPRFLQGFRRWAASASGVPTLVQLNHPGRQAPKQVNQTTVGPSAIGVKKAGLFGVPRALQDHEVDAIVEQFAAAAALMQAAGFAGVQIHAAHGYLISQFLSPLSNQRSDRWGGCVENRARFLLEVVRATRKATGPEGKELLGRRHGKEFSLAVKLNSADFQRGGFSAEEALQVAAMLEAEGIDLLEISGGTYESAAMMGSKKKASTLAREAYFLDYAEGIRRVVRRTPLMLTGGFRSRAGIEGALASGAVDVVGLARPLATEPDLPRALLAGTQTQAVAPPASLGLSLLDDLVALSWTQEQMMRLADGKEPDLRLSRLLTLLKKLREIVFGRASSALPASVPA